MFVLELNEHPGYYGHKNSGGNTEEQYKGLVGKFVYGVHNYTNVMANAKVLITRAKAEKEMKRVKDYSIHHSTRKTVDLNIVEVFMVSERELAENPMLQKAFDDFRLAQKLSVR